MLSLPAGLGLLFALPCRHACPSLQDCKSEHGAFCMQGVLHAFERHFFLQLKQQPDGRRNVQIIRDYIILLPLTCGPASARPPSTRVGKLQSDDSFTEIYIILILLVGQTWYADHLAV